MGVRDTIGTVCPACRVWKIGGCQHLVARPSCVLVGGTTIFHWVLKRSTRNWATAAEDKWGKELAIGRDPSPHPYLPGPEFQALRNLGLGKQPKGPGLELA